MHSLINIHEGDWGLLFRERRSLSSFRVLDVPPATLFLFSTFLVLYFSPAYTRSQCSYYIHLLYIITYAYSMGDPPLSLSERHPHSIVDHLSGVTPILFSKNS